MKTSVELWILFAVIVSVALAVDLGLKSHRHRTDGVPLPEAARWTALWVGLALLFAGIVYVLKGHQSALEFLTGYLIEESLSIDNMFVFVLIFQFFKIAAAHQPRILKWGIFGAILMRFILIFAGVSLVNQFHWLLYIFGGFLIVTAIKMFFSDEKETNPRDNKVLKLFERFVPVTTEQKGGQFFIEQNRRSVATPLFAALLVVEVSDLVFAMDSIPAVLAVSKDPFIVFSSNIFAILGLRALYFLVSGFLGLFRFLRYGLAIVLSFIGCKMLLFEIYPIPIVVSLAVVAGVLSFSILASVVLKEKKSMTKTVAFHTFGCKVNQYETEELREQLRLGGYQVVPMANGADVNIVNSCTVTADADSSCRQLVRKLLRERPESRVVVTGCYAERSADELRQMSSRVEVFGNHEKPMIAIALGVPTACVQEAANSGVTSLADRTRAYIKIQDGCDAKCTYCIIPSVRPNLICRPPELILKEAQNLLARGFKEIVLTGVRLGRYSYTSPHPNPLPQGEGAARPGEAKSFGDLVRSLLNLPGDFRIRLSSIEVTEIPDEVIELAATHPKLCPFFHIPLQSGDDEILKRMGRWYTSAQYRDRIRQIKARIPDVALSADVIVGFAGEEGKHFQNTVKLLEDEGFSRVHAFRYSVRPGTSAERLSNHVDPRAKGERTRLMTQIDKTLRVRYAEKFLGKPVRVLMESDGSGYTERYVRVRIDRSMNEGKFELATPRHINTDGLLVA